MIRIWPVRAGRGNFGWTRFTISRGIPTGVTLLQAVGARSHHHAQVTVAIH